MLDVQCSMFDVHFLVNLSYETEVYFSIRLAAFQASGRAETLNIGSPCCKLLTLRA
jgi:hypothetical protein